MYVTLYDMDVKVNTAIVLDTRKTRKKDKANPVKLRVTYQRKQMYYSVIHPDTKKPIYMMPEDFKKMNGDKPRAEYKTVKTILNGIEADAVTLIGEMKTFSFKTFLKKFINQKKSNIDLSAAFDAKATKEWSDGNISTSKLYTSAKKSFEIFNGGKLQFQQIDIQWLKDYEKSMGEDGKTTVGIYCRNLRAIMNGANIAGDDYPFGEGKYQIPTARNTKKALDTSDIAKLLKFKSKDPILQEARDYWIFSYLGNGINPKDIFLLKQTSVQNGEIHFNRAKTKRMKIAPPAIIITITPAIREIINRQKAKEGDYLFPVLRKGMTAEAQYKAVQAKVEFINNNIRVVADKLKITKGISTYVARHSFASVLMHNGVPFRVY